MLKSQPSIESVMVSRQRNWRLIVLRLLLVGAFGALAITCAIQTLRVHRYKARNLEARTTAWHQTALSEVIPAKREADQTNLKLAPGEDIAVLDQALAEVFPLGFERLSPQERCIGLLKYVAVRLEAKPSSGSASSILQQGHAICGGMSDVLQQLLRRARVPTRYVGIFNWPLMGSHAACEAWYDGGWHFLDPTYGVFFYSADSFGSSGLGTILPLSELLENPDAGTLMQVVHQPWTGSFSQEDRDFAIVPARADYLADKLEGGLLASYRSALAQMFPIAYDDGSCVAVALEADLTRDRELVIGQIDNSSADVARQTIDRNNTACAQIGGWKPSVIHTLLISAKAGCIVQIEYTSTSKAFDELTLFPLKDANLLGRYRHGQSTVFRLAQTSGLGSAMIICPKGLNMVDAIAIRRYDILQDAALSQENP